MNSAKLILKNAFTDAQLVDCTEKSHNFSNEFEFSMRRVIKYQSGILSLINTTGKRVACVILTVLICLTSVACGIKEIREPIVKEIKKFYVNAKELLTGTAADEVAELFPSDVTEIIGTSYVSKSKRQYVIDDEETVTKFIELLSETCWGEPEQFEEFDTVSTYWTFDFYNNEGKSLFQIKMCNDSIYVKAKVAVIKDGEEKHFYISNKVYNEILAFTNKKYYLHDSKSEKPDKEYFESKKNEVLKGLNDLQQKELKKRIRDAHYEIEELLLQKVSVLKERDSIYWQYVLSGEKFIDPIAGYECYYSTNKEVVSALEYAVSVIKDKQLRKNLQTALNLWNKSVLEHNIEGLFKVHEYVHDYDYYAVNYPTAYVYDIYADYQGLDDYFGRLGD